MQKSERMNFISKSWDAKFVDLVDATYGVDMMYRIDAEWDLCDGRNWEPKLVELTSEEFFTTWRTIRKITR